MTKTWLQVMWLTFTEHNYRTSAGWHPFRQLSFFHSVFSSLAVSTANNTDSRGSLISIESNPSNSDRNSEKMDGCEKVRTHIWVISALSPYSNALLTYDLCSLPDRSRWSVMLHALTNWTRQRRAVCLCVSCILWKPYQKVHTHQSDNIPSVTRDRNI